MAVGFEISEETLYKLISFLFWNFLYLWCAVTRPERSPEWCSRVLTLVHGSVATIVGLVQCDVFSLTLARLTTNIMPWHYTLMVWSWGYFAFDLLWCLIYWSENTLIICHHISALFGIAVYMYKDHTGCTYPCLLAMMEITNPLLQTRWLLKKDGYDKTITYFLVEATYLISFVVIRGLVGTYVVFKMMTSNIFDTDEKFMSLINYSVSVALVYQVCSYVVYKYKDKIDQFHGFLETGNDN